MSSVPCETGGGRFAVREGVGDRDMVDEASKRGRADEAREELTATLCVGGRTLREWDEWDEWG